MKKNLLSILMLLTFSFFTFPQDYENAGQVLLPIDVYVGDHAEIRYTFRSAIDFFAGDKSAEKKDLKNPFTGLEENFSVLTAELYQNDMEYTVRFVIIPWKTGNISFPSFNLNEALGIVSHSEENKTSDSVNAEDELSAADPEFYVALYPIQIKSIVEKTNNHQMMPPVPPVIIPGTTYVIFLIALGAIIILIVFFRVLLKFNAIKRKWKLYLKRRAYKKNAEDALKKIKKLYKNSKCSDIEFCTALQNITRNYLEFRFDYRFTAISSSRIREAFEKICIGDIPSDIAYSVEDLASMFTRTDYIRYAHDSIDSQLYPPSEHQAALAKTERKSLTEMIIKAIDCFETSEGQED